MGTYLISYVATVSGRYSLAVTLGSNHIAGSPFALDITTVGGDMGEYSAAGLQQQPAWQSTTGRSSSPIGHGGTSGFATTEVVAPPSNSEGSNNASKEVRGAVREHVGDLRSIQGSMKAERDRQKAKMKAQIAGAPDTPQPSSRSCSCWHSWL